MSDAYSREDFMQKYGVDPVEAMAKQDSDSSLTNHLKSLAVGAATIPTDIVALPGLIYNAGSALGKSYANDTKFLDEYAKNVQVENAQQNIQNHLQQVAQSWRNAGVSDNDIASGLEDYKKSKGFEDFGMEQLSGTAYLAAKAKDTVRKLLGDNRTDEQRPWTETAAEVLGGALIPGPEGIAAKAGTAAAKTAVTNAVFNNPVGKLALKGAELATPLTTPYTAGNIMANTAVGVGIDQALRYAQSKPTALSDDNAVAQIAGTTAIVAGTAAFVAAMKGRSAQLLERTVDNATTRALKDLPTTEARVSPEPKIGEAIIVGGDEQQLQPPAAGGIGQRLIGQYFDEGYGVRGQIRRQHGADIANNFEAAQSNTGAVLQDRAHNSATEATQSLFDSIDALPNQGQRATLTAMVHNTIVTRQGLNEQALRNTIAELEKSGKPSKTLDELRETLARVERDDPDVRQALPDIPTGEKEILAKAFREDKSPEMLRVKQDLRNWGDLMAELEVRKGKWTAQYAQDMRQREPYYIPLQNDPLKGDTGAARLWRGVSNSFDRSMREPVEGTRARGVMESPIEALSNKIPEPRKAGDPETRITAAHDPRATIFQYTKASFLDLAHTRERNEAIRLMSTNKDGSESALVKNGNMVYDRSIGNEGWWTAEQAASDPRVRALLDRANTVPQWQAGHLRIWKLGDQDWASALRHDPVRFNGMMKTLGVTSRWFKFFTTGRGNPFFAAKGAVYDLVIGMLTRMPNRSFGTASYLAHRFLPEKVARYAVGAIPDPTALVALPYHLVMATTEVLAKFGAKVIENGLKNMPEFSAFRSVVGERMFNKMLNTATKIASKTENLATNVIKREGGSHGRISDNIDVVRGSYAMLADRIPSVLKGAWRFYTDVLDSVYLAPKRMFYTENYALLHQKFKGKIPEAELEKLIYETRSIGGDMNKIPASMLMKQVELATPYASQTKLGAYHLIRNMGDPATAGYMLPRLAMMMYAVGQSIYFRTYWNEESRQDYWQRTPEYERWRSFDIPGPQLLWAWFNGENPNYDRSLIYRLTLPPDIAGIIASTAAMMQMMGVLPHGLTPKPLSEGVGKVWIDSLTPAMPPLLQALLAQSGAKLDPQGADLRGGSLIKSFSNTFRAGPAAEAASNLGQETNSTSLMMNALFGSFGSYLASGTDVMMHAARFNTDNSPRASADFGAGLKAATTEVFTKMQGGTPDVPLLWQNKEKYKVGTAAWQYMKENTNDIQSIVGMRDQAQGKAGQLQRQYANAVGGIPVEAITDLTLNQIGAEIAQWSRGNGELAKLKKEYNDLANGMNRPLTVQYNLPQSERDRRTNIIIRAMQDNMEQQHLATKYMEQQIAEKYGQQLAPRLRGRDINMETLNKMMRESLGAPSLGAGVEQ